MCRVSSFSVLSGVYFVHDASSVLCVIIIVCYTCVFLFIGASLSDPHSDGKSRIVVREWKNDGKIRAAPHYCKFGTVVHVQKIHR